MLPRLLEHNLKLIICGTAAGNTSARLQQYYTGPSNKFWTVLYEIGLTPVLLTPIEYQKLLEYDIGLTDLVKNKSGMDKNLLSSDVDRDRLVGIIKKYKSKHVCFNGKRAAKEFFLHPVNYGLQKEISGRTKFFVAPSTSSAANRYWDINKWVELAELCNSSG